MAKNDKSREIMDGMVEVAYEMQKMLNSNSTKNFGQLLNENWLLKRKMAQGVSSRAIDKWYRISKKNGAEGGKILGAGGGGFLLLYADPKKHKKITRALPQLSPLLFKLEPQGSKIIFVGE